MARSRDVNKIYSVDSKKRKNEKKRTSLVADAETFKQHDANGPPDKAKDMKTVKRVRRRGKGVINSIQSLLFFDSENKCSIFLAQNVAGFSKRGLQILLAKNEVIEIKMVN